jgi:protocatechuate 3,4-dioxygenase beta subunit
MPVRKVPEADGRFTFESICPGAYPGGNVPPHVQFTAVPAERRSVPTPQVNLPAARGGDARGPEEIAAELRLKARNPF